MRCPRRHALTVHAAGYISVPGQSWMQSYIQRYVRKSRALDRSRQDSFLYTHPQDKLDLSYPDDSNCLLKLIRHGICNGICIKQCKNNEIHWTWWAKNRPIGRDKTSELRKRSINGYIWWRRPTFNRWFERKEEKLKRARNGCAP